STSAYSTPLHSALFYALHATPNGQNKADCEKIHRRKSASSSPPRPPARVPRPQAVSRSRTDTVQAQSPCAKSGATKSPPSCSSASCRSSASSVRSLRTSKQTCASSPPPSAPCRRLPRPTSSACSKTPTLPPSTPSALPSSLRISSSLAGFVESAR
ncbi:hypothetical protein HDU84_003628, partial [Entophlyctis sp. JEL0112]